jgi:hypothetical protein
MLFVGAASYAQPAGQQSKFKFGRQTGTSQNAQVIKLNAQSSKIKQTINNNDAFVYQGVNPGQISYLVTILRLKTWQT